MAANLYSFGPFRMDPAQGLLWCGEKEIILTPKAFETLLALVENAGAIVAKHDLLTRLWPDSFVEENNLAQNISLVRKILASEDPAGTYVQTIPRRGYRFVAPVNLLTGEPVTAMSAVVVPDAPDWQPPPTRYARSGDVNIAYQVVGDGPIDLVFVMGWVSQIEMFWTEPSFARFLRRLASFSRLILFDKRGTGLSDSVPLTQLPTLEQRIDDVRAVMHAVGSRRAVLIGVSEGGTMASLFAATWPENVAGLVIIGGYSRRLWAPDYPWGLTPENRDEFLARIERDWGGPVGLVERAPSKVNDPEFRRWWARYLRAGASPGAAVTLTRMNAGIDIRNVLPSIRVPSLVVHREGDRCLAAAEGRYIADRIPGAEYVELEGDDHLPFVGDQDSILQPIEEFVLRLGESPPNERVLATLLFIEASGEAGGAVAKLAAEAEREASWFQGEPRGPFGRGLFASFSGPARAVRCARAILDAAEAAGVKVSAALHTGECEIRAGRLTGRAAEVGEAILGQAKRGEILVSNTVSDLVAGSGLEFTERGGCDLAELGSWRLYSVDRSL